MISYRRSDILQRKDLLEHTPMVVDIFYGNLGSHVILDNVYPKGWISTPVTDEKRAYVMEAIKKIMQEMGIWYIKNVETRQKGKENIAEIFERLRKFPRIESIVAEPMTGHGHVLADVVVSK